MSVNLLDLLDERKRQKALLALQASFRDPDLIGRARKLAAQLGIPVDVVARNIDAARRKVQQLEDQAALKLAPLTRAWLAKPGNAALARDSVPGLARIEKSAQGLAARRPVAGRGVTASVLERGPGGGPPPSGPLGLPFPIPFPGGEGNLRDGLEDLKLYLRAGDQTLRAATSVMDQVMLEAAAKLAPGFKDTNDRLYRSLGATGQVLDKTFHHVADAIDKPLIAAGEAVDRGLRGAGQAVDKAARGAASGLGQAERGVSGTLRGAGEALDDSGLAPGVGDGLRATAGGLDSVRRAGATTLRLTEDGVSGAYDQIGIAGRALGLDHPAGGLLDDAGALLGGASEGLGGMVSGLGESALLLDRVATRMGIDRIDPYTAIPNWLYDGHPPPPTPGLTMLGLLAPAPFSNVRLQLRLAGNGLAYGGGEIKKFGGWLDPPEERSNLVTTAANGLGNLGVQTAVATLGLPALPLLAAQGVDQMADTARLDGKYGTPEGDLSEALGGLWAMTDMIPLDQIIKLPPKLKGAALHKLAELAKTGSIQLVQTAASSLFNNQVERWFLNPKAELWDKKDTKGLWGAVTSAFGWEGLVALFTHHHRRIQRARRAADADAAAKVLDDLSRKVPASPVAARSPEAMRDFLDSAGGRRPVTVPVAKVRSHLDSLKSDEDRSAFLEKTGLKEQIMNAEALGTDVSMPASVYLTEVAPTAHEHFREDLRLGPEAGSLREAQAFRSGEDARAEALTQAMVRKAAHTIARDAPAQRVREDLFGQLRAAGVPVAQAQAKAVLDAHRYATRAARTSGTAWDAYQTSNVSVRRELPGELSDHLGRLDPVIDLVRAAAGARKGRGPTLAAFLAKRGGVKDEGGALAGMGADRWHAGRPGQRRLAHDGGMSLDEAARLAADHGYLPHGEPAPAKALVEALRGELAGTPRRAAPLAERQGPRAKAAQQLQAALKRLGVDPRKASNDEIKAVLDEQAREVRAGDGEVRTVRQSDAKGGARAEITLGQGEALVRLFQGDDVASLLQASGHLWLDEMIHDAGLPGADPKLRADLAAVRKWAGLAKGQDFGPRHHEKFARALAAYLMAGRAPTPALAPVFRRFKAWLIGLYGRFAPLDGAVSEEMRGVFDRLIATDAEIAAARGELGLEPLFETAEQAGMTPAAFEAYRRAAQAADEAAAGTLRGEIMRQVKQRQGKAWAAERARLRAALEPFADETPDLKALRLLKETPLSRAAVVRAAGGSEAILSLLPGGRSSVVTRKGGADPDFLAPLAGFDSGEAMLQALAAHEQERQALRARGDRRSVRDARLDEAAQRGMINRHGDNLTDGSIGEAAKDHVSEGAWPKLLGDEAVALARRLGLPHDGTLWSEAALGDRARAELAGRRAGTVEPEIYRRAQLKAGEAAHAALAKGDLAAALDSRLRQLMNLHMWREAKAARDLVETVAVTLAELDAGRGLDGVDPGYRAQIDGVLAQVGHHRPAAPAEGPPGPDLAAWTQARRAEGEDFNPPAFLLDPRGSPRLGELSVEQLQGLNDTLAGLAHLGRMKERRWEGGEFATVAGARTALAGSVADNLPPGRDLAAGDKPVEGPKGPIDWVLGMHRKMEHLAQLLDGFKENGLAWRLLFEPVSRAGDAKAQRTAASVRAMRDLYRLYGKAERATMYRPRACPEVGASLSRWQMIGVALNWGTHGGRAAVVAGWPNQSHASVQAMLDAHLTERDWRFVTGVWKHLADLQGDIAEHELAMTGVKPEMVQPAMVQTPFGPRPGGFYPLKFDDPSGMEASGDRAERMLNGGFVRGATRAGFEALAAPTGRTRPVRLDQGVMFEHLADVIHDLTHRKALLDVKALLDGPDVARAVRAAAGAEGHRQMQAWLRDLAAGEPPPAGGLEKAVNRLRGGLTIANLGWQFGLASARLTGFSQAASKIGGSWAGVGLIRFNQDRQARAAEVRRLSPYMRTRAATFDGDIADLRTLEYSARSGAVKDSYFALLAGVDHEVSFPIWIGAYEKAMKEGRDEGGAVAYADRVVRTTLGSGRLQDSSGAQRGGELWKLFAGLDSYVSATWNLNVDELHRLRRGGLAYGPRFAANFIWINILPELLLTLAGRWLSPDDDEDDDKSPLLDEAFKRGLGGYAGGLFGLHDLAGALTDDGFHNTTLLYQLGKAWITTETDAARKAFHLDPPEPDPRAALDTAAALASPAARLPLSGALGAAEAARDLASRPRPPGRPASAASGGAQPTR